MTICSQPPAVVVLPIYTVPWVCPSSRIRGEHEGLPPHPCPYASEIGGDSSTLCQCCASCEGGCADDI